MSTEMDSLAKEAIILKLFRLYRSMDGKNKPTLDALIKTYLEPVAEYSLSALEQAFERIRDNEVEGLDPNWPINVPVWVSQVKMLDRILNRVRRTDDGIVVYRIGEQPPPGYVPLGPTELEIEGRLMDVSALSFEAKEYAIKHGRLPDSPAEIEAPNRVVPRLKRMP